MWPQIESALRDSFARVLTKVATLLPAVLALVLVLLIAGLFGALLAFGLRRLLTALRFDERMQSGRAAGRLEWTSIQSPTLALSRIVFWTCMLVGVVVGVAAFASGYSNSDLMAASLFPYVAHIVGAALLLLAGTIAARFLARTVLIGAVNMNLHYARLLSQGVKWLVLVLTAAMVLDHLNIGGVIVELAFGIIFGGIVLTLALAIGLGSREIVSRSFEQDAPRTPAEPSVPKVTHF
jgi:uncharacterized membrane protein